MPETRNAKLETRNCFTDWHCHVLPGLDDGPATLDEAVVMAVALRDAGFSTVYCTPHLIKGAFDADNETVKSGVAALQAELDSRRIDLRLFAGREYYLDEYLAGFLADPLPLGDTSYILVEIPYHAVPEFVNSSLRLMAGSGFVPMIAHPERCPLLTMPEKEKESRFGLLGSLFGSSGARRDAQDRVSGEATLLDQLKEMGCCFQGDLGSFAGLYGERVRGAALQMRQAGLYTHFGSDLHAARQMHVLAHAAPGQPGPQDVNAGENRGALRRGSC